MQQTQTMRSNLKGPKWEKIEKIYRFLQTLCSMKFLFYGINMSLYRIEKQLIFQSNFYMITARVAISIKKIEIYFATLNCNKINFSVILLVQMRKAFCF